MAGFRKDKTTAAQTAANVAGGVTEAYIASGGLTDAVDVTSYLVTVFKGLYAEMAPIVDGDNALFAEVEAAGGSANPNSAPVQVPGDPGSVKFTGGKFKGKSIADVYNMSAEEAKASHGHTFGDGASYITGYVATPKNSIAATRAAAEAFLAQLAA